MNRNGGRGSPGQQLMRGPCLRAVQALAMTAAAALLLVGRVDAQPFLQCPPVGADTSCGVLFTITAGGCAVVTSDPSQPPFDNIEDTLTGVQNNSAAPVCSIALNAPPPLILGVNDIFGFDGDGICAGYVPGPPMCPYGPTGYEGPGVSFSVVSAFDGVVQFTPCLPPGGSAYFGLEEAVTTGGVGSCNGNGICEAGCGETCGNCVADCGVCQCPNGVCESGESNANCPQDCPLPCGDGICDPGIGERCDTCQGDCGICFCGDNTVSAGEDCDPPGSLTCPGSTACGVDCTCATAPPPDHFQCYEVKPSTFSTAPVTVTDQFGTLTGDLRFPHRLCNPTDKNGEGITDPTDHLVGYGAKYSHTFTKQLNQMLVDQFGTLFVDVTRPDLLMVPSSKDGVPQQPPLDHFQCYKVKRSRGTPKFVKRTVTIANQFETTTLLLKGPYRLCAPADKNGEDPTAPDHPDHLTCYKTKGGRFTGSTHTISNQFDANDVLQVIHRRELCVPSLKNPGSTTTTIATTTTTTSTTMASTTSTTTSTTTTTTMYGSPSRAFLEPAASLLD
jgi:hypothetical protein